MCSILYELLKCSQIPPNVLTEYHSDDKMIIKQQMHIEYPLYTELHSGTMNRDGARNQMPMLRLCSRVLIV